MFTNLVSLDERRGERSLQNFSQQDSGQGEFINRELSWLEFNRRVLSLALDERTPLLERVKFLSIFNSNLDDFYMKRVGGLKRQIAAGMVNKSADGMTPIQQFIAIREAILPMLQDQARVYIRHIRPALIPHGIEIVSWNELSLEELDRARNYFRDNVFPVLTPLAVDPGHPFPFMSNLSTSVGVTLRHPERDELLFARIKVPPILPQMMDLSPAEADNYRFIPLYDLIRNNLEDLFPGMNIIQTMLFRIARNASIEMDEEGADDLLEMMEEEVRRRKFATVVRLEHGPNPDPWMLKFLTQELELSEGDVYELPAELDYSALKPIFELNVPGLKYQPWFPVVPPILQDSDISIFNVIRQADLLVHHPFESFTASVERFVQSAIEDPNVVGIKMTVYRTGDQSPFMPLLIQAARAGKQVVCLVELKARFDEERNIYWAQELEKAGVHVVYGIVGLKTHAKLILIVRREADGIRSYAHIGTGNYHVQTANLYTDLGLFTAKREFTDDLLDLFNCLTGRGIKRSFRKLLVAPVNMRDRFIEMIEREVEHAQAGRPALIIAKANSLVEHTICRALYRASQAGVEIRLIIRGSCCLRPGVPGMSENISVMSIVGQLLEHSRLYYFQNGADDLADGEFYLGSADWMYRNLSARVEAIAPIEDKSLKRKCWELIQVILNDRRSAWDLRPDGTYVQRKPDPGRDEALGTHQTLMRIAEHSAEVLT